MTNHDELCEKVKSIRSDLSDRFHFGKGLQTEWVQEMLNRLIEVEIALTSGDLVPRERLLTAEEVMAVLTPIYLNEIDVLPKYSEAIIQAQEKKVRGGNK